MVNAAIYASGSSTPVVPVVQRPPLPPFDHDTTDPDTGAPLPVHTTLNGTIPPLGDTSYHRANLWGMTLPDLPEIPAGARGPAASRMLTYLFQQYPREFQTAGMKRYASYGYKHWWLSWPDARSWGVSLQSYVDDTKRIQDAGLTPCHFLRSKDFDGNNPNIADVDPVVDALTAIDGIRWASHAWEASLFNSPEHFRAMIDHDATHAPQTRWCVHLQEGYADFGPNGEGHGPAFWIANINVGVKTLLYQYRAFWSAGMMQARGNDVSVRLIQGGLWGLPETVQWVPFEVIATKQFNNETLDDGRMADEDTGDLRGYEMACTKGPLAPAGYGGGARRPDGTAL